MSAIPPSVSVMTTLAVLGTGHMGAPIARRLLMAGHAVTVWNRTLSRAEVLTEAGARLAASPAESIAGAEIVIIMLTGHAAVNAALFGPGGAAPLLRPGSCVIQMSTIAPREVRALAGRLPEGVDLVDAPVAGSTGAAEAGALLVLAAGQDAPLKRVIPVLGALGTVRRCGDLGDGSALKLVLNTALATAMTALADTLKVASALGVDRDTALEALAAGPLGGAVRRAAASGASFSLALAAKDMDLAVRELGRAPAPIARVASQVLQAAPDQGADIATLIPQE